MPHKPLLPALDLLLRGGSCALLLLLAPLLLRDDRQALAARLGALFALGAAAYALCASNELHAAVGRWAAPLMALASGNNLVMWLFAHALFDDEFRPHRWHLASWLAIAGTGLADGLVFEPAHMPAAAPVGQLLAVQAVVFAVLAGAQTLGSWRGDLVEPRRRLRLFVVVAAAGYAVVTGLAGIVGEHPTPAAAGVAEAGLLAAIAATVAWSLLRVSGGEMLFPVWPEQTAAAAASSAPHRRTFDAADKAAVAALERAMMVDRLYRQEGLSIGRLTQLQDLPE
jgi:hypothetical protein